MTCVCEVFLLLHLEVIVVCDCRVEEFWILVVVLWCTGVASSCAIVRLKYALTFCGRPLVTGIRQTGALKFLRVRLVAIREQVRE